LSSLSYRIPECGQAKQNMSRNPTPSNNCAGKWRLVYVWEYNRC
jgi:hypothetical protein